MIVLPGFPVAMGGSAYRYIGAAVGSAGSGVINNKQITISPHADTLPGDLLVAYAVSGSSGSGGIPRVPAAWDSLRSMGNSFYMSHLCSGVRAVGDTSYQFTSTCLGFCVIILAFRRASVGSYAFITSAGSGAVNLGQITNTASGSDMIAFPGLISGNTDAPTITSAPVGMELLASVTSPLATGAYRVLAAAYMEKNLAGGNTGTRPFEFSHASRSVMIEIRK